MGSSLGQTWAQLVVISGHVASEPCFHPPGDSQLPNTLLVNSPSASISQNWFLLLAT